MKQFQFEYKNISNFKREIARIKKYINVVLYSRLVIQVYTKLTDYKEIKAMTDILDEQLPDAMYYGCQTYANIFEGDISDNHTIFVCTIFEEFSSNVKIFHIDPNKHGADPAALRNIVTFCNFNKWVKAVNIITTINAAKSYKLGRENLNIRDEVKIYGAVSMHPKEILSDDCFVFSKQGGVSKTACLFIVMGGDNLFINTNYVTGWKGLGKHYKITDCEGSVLKTIDNQPAFDQTYKKYLKMEASQVYNIMKFPLLIEDNGIECLRTCTNVKNDGSMETFVDVDKGSDVRLTYGDPNTIVESLKTVLKELVDFSPEVIQLYPCTTRCMFLREDLVHKELGCFEELAPTTGFYTRGELYRDNKFLHQLNCTLVIVSLREGEAVNLNYNVDEFFDDEIETDTLVDHLVNFIGEATQEVENQFTNTLNSLASIYQSLHIINIKENTFETFSSPDYMRKLMKNTKDAVKQLELAMKKTSTSEYTEKILAFTDLTTVAQRLEGKKVIAEEYVSKEVGWLRCQFVALDYDENNQLESVIFTTQVIDDEKKKVAKLKQESTTDELTGFLNRRGYEEILEKNPEIPPQQNFVYVVMDVNGLKVTNDNLGHEAGDELICGAAECIRNCFGVYGSLFRTGGDEFAAILFLEDKELEKAKKNFEEITSKWTGKFVKELSVSCGYVQKSEYPDLSVSELAKISDQRMYKAKSEYYKSKGIDRRGQQQAYAAICASYTKILKINLTKDTYKIISSTDQILSNPNSEKISDFCKEFAESGMIHEEDKENFCKKTEINYLRKYFNDNKSLNIFYRYKSGKTFRHFMMELIRADDYSPENQKLYLYVKDIDKQE